MMQKTKRYVLAASLLLVLLLAAPLPGMPVDGAAATSWWQGPADLAVEWLGQAMAWIGGPGTVTDGGDGPSLEPEAPQGLEGDDPNANPSDDNSYPILDPNG